MSEFPSNNQLNTQLQSIQEYFGENITVEALANKSEAERIAYLEYLVSTHEISEEQQSAFLEAFENEINEFSDQAYVYIRELDQIIDSSSTSMEVRARAELVRNELIELRDILEDEVSSNWGDAIDEYNEKNIDLTDGSDHTFTENSDVENGDNIIIDATSSNSTEVAGFGLEDPHPEWTDIDGDGIGDADPMLDANGHATVDVNGDGEINEKDSTDYVAAVSPQTLKLNLQEGSTLEMSTYDATSGELRFKVTKENGDIYYLTILGVTSDTNLNIVFTGANGNLNQSILETMPDNLTKILFESETRQSSGHSVYNILNPDAVSENEGDFYTIYNMKDHYNSDVGKNSIEVASTTDDFINGREYTINFDGTDGDILDLTFPPNAEINFETTGVDGNIVMTVTTPDGTITVNLNGLRYEAELSLIDSITITGGNIDWDANHTTIETFRVPLPGGINSIFGGLVDLMMINGISLWEDANNNGYVIASGSTPVNEAPSGA